MTANHPPVGTHTPTVTCTDPAGPGVWAGPAGCTQTGMTEPAENVESTAPEHGSITLSEDGSLIVVTGEIDKDVVRHFRVTVRPSQWPARVDARGVTFMSSAGLELMVHLARKQKRAGGELELIDPPTSLRLLLNQTGLNRVFRSVPAPAAPA